MGVSQTKQSIQEPDCLGFLTRYVDRIMEDWYEQLLGEMSTRGWPEYMRVILALLSQAERSGCSQSSMQQLLKLGEVAHQTMRIMLPAISDRRSPPFPGMTCPREYETTPGEWTRLTMEMWQCVPRSMFHEVGTDIQAALMHHHVRDWLTQLGRPRTDGVPEVHENTHRAPNEPPYVTYLANEGLSYHIRVTDNWQTRYFGKTLTVGGVTIAGVGPRGWLTATNPVGAPDGTLLKTHQHLHQCSRRRRRPWRCAALHIRPSVATRHHHANPQEPRGGPQGRRRGRRGAYLHGFQCRP